MEYVLTEAGNIKIGPKGSPLVSDDGKEFEIDAINANNRITALVAESNGRRKKLAEMKAEFESAADNAATLQAQVDSLDDKQKLKIEDLKGQINKAWETKEQTWAETEKNLTAQLSEATTGVKFATSKVVAGTVLPPDIAKATFGHHFNPDGTANDANGNTILSASNPGEPAGFDEALGIIINSRADKDSILRASDASGSGSAGTGSGDFSAEASSMDNIAAGLSEL